MGHGNKGKGKGERVGHDDKEKGKVKGEKVGHDNRGRTLQNVTQEKSRKQHIIV